MNKKKIIALLLTTFLASNLTASIVNADVNNEEYKKSYMEMYQAEPGADKLIQKSEITATATSSQQGEGPEKAIDGNTSTLWHTPWSGVDVANNPQSLILDLGKDRNISSINITPRQSGNNGKIKDYKVYAGDTVIAEGTWKTDSETKYIRLSEPVTTDNIRIEAISTVGDEPNKFVSIAEVEIYEATEAPKKLVETNNLVINNGIGGDISEQLATVKDLEEGTGIIRFVTTGSSVQSLFSISNNTRANEHFHVYISDGKVGYELRKQSGNVSTGVVNKPLNQGVNTIAFRATKSGGYTLYLNGEQILNNTLDNANFLKVLEGANTFKLGTTDRAAGSAEYNFTGKIDYFKMYDKPLTDQYLKEITGQTSVEELPLPEGTLKTEPIDIFKPGDLGSNNYRIPAMITTTQGTLIASIDARVGGGHDSPNNIDTAVKRSTDGGVTWDEGQIVLNYPDKASGIDTSLVQDSETGEIFMLVDAFPHNKGTFSATRGSGFSDITVNGKTVRAMNLTHTDGTKYYAIPGEEGQEFGAVVDGEGNLTSYKVDVENNLYKDDVKVGNTFGATSELKADGTCYLALISSKDDGVTWSKPRIISGQFKEEWMTFLGTGPGRGYQMKNGENAGRLIFPVYSLNRNQKQSSAVIYSDDNGKTWQLGESVNENRVVNGVTIKAETFTGARDEEMTEAQVVEMPNGELKMFMRNPSRANPAVATSKDGGETWEDIIEYETDLKEPYCQLSVINYEGEIDGKPAIIFANPDSSSRAEGAVRIGLINNTGTEEEPIWDFEWKYRQLVKPGYYAYSCLTQLQDGTIGLFYEGTANTEMSYTRMNVDYLKADLLAEAPVAKVSSITSLDEDNQYVAGDTVNLKVTFDQTVSLFGDRSITLIVDGKEISGELVNINGREHKFTTTLPMDINEGSHLITIKAKDGLDIVNSLGRVLNLTENIETTSTLVITGDSEVNKPVYSYELNQNFNGTSDLVDISADATQIGILEESSILVNFNSNSSNANQILFSATDINDPQSHLYIKLLNGKIRYEVREAGTLKLAYTYNGISLNDGKDHKIILTSGSRGSELYIDGAKVYGTTALKYTFSSVNDINTMTIGAIKNSNNSNGSEYFNGKIGYLNIYNSELTVAEAIELTKLDDETGGEVSKPEEYDRLIELINSEREVNMVFTGDSITHGPLHTKGYRSYSEHFNERIRGEEVNGRVKDGNFIINTGVSSATTRDILNNFDKVIGDYNPEVVFLMIGMNDCTTISIDEYEANLREIIRKVRERGAIPVLQTSNITRGDRANLLPFMQRLRDVAEAENVYYIDHTKFWQEEYSKDSSIVNTWLNDSIHPNEVGHLEMAKLIFRELGLDNENSFTNNLTYPLSTEGSFVDTRGIYPYPEYKEVADANKVVSYKVDKEFYLDNNIDISGDINKVKDLEQGSIVAKFNLTNNNLAQTLISLSDGNDPSSNATLAINSGKIHYEVRENGTNIVNLTSSTGGYNDGRWHTVVLSSGDGQTEIYIDGELILTDTSNGFFSDINTPDNFNIGRNVHNTGGEWYYSGAISNVDIYSDVLTEEQIASVSEKPATINKAMNLQPIKDIISENADGPWVFLGDEDTASKGDTYGYKNFVEYFEERVRWDLNGGSMIKRRKFMINSAVDGAKSQDILTNFDAWAKNYKPKVVSIMIGGRETVSVEEFRVNLNAILDKVVECGAVPFLQTPVIKGNDISEYIDVIRQVAEEREIALIDHYGYFAEIEAGQPNVRESFLTANSEPNHRGHLEIGKRMLLDLGISGGTVTNFNIPYSSSLAEDLKVELQAVIDEATELINTSEEGEEPGQYPIGTKEDLSLSIAFAQKEIDRTNAQVQVVNSRINELKTSIEVFKSLVNEGNDYSGGDFNEDGVVDIKDLANISKVYGKNSEDNEWSSLSKYDLNNDNIIDDKDVEIVAKINLKN